MNLEKKVAFTLTELVVSVAIMGTLAAVAVPMYSDITESSKEKKTMANIDNILLGAHNWYNQMVTEEGRGRFPNQEDFNDAISDTTVFDGDIANNEWYLVFGEDIKSPYKTEYRYNVTAGSGSGELATSPILTVWDTEDQGELTKKLIP